MVEGGVVIAVATEAATVEDRSATAHIGVVDGMCLQYAINYWSNSTTEGEVGASSLQNTQWHQCHTQPAFSAHFVDICSVIICGPETRLSYDALHTTECQHCITYISCIQFYYYDLCLS